MPIAQEDTIQTGWVAKPPPLENGDRLRTREFLRRYQASPQLKKAQLIEGVVHMPSPVRVAHGKPDNLIQRWLGYYETYTPGVECLTNTTVILDAENTVQPDALLRLLPARGGRCRENPEGLLAGPPELVVEIASTSASIELGKKRRAYQRNGILEYLVWRTFEARFDWFCLEEDEYAAQAPDAQGRLTSRVFPGLQLDIASLLRLDAAAVLASLQSGVDSPEHRRFPAHEDTAT
jgi:Uma2 family endonuclease